MIDTVLSIYIDTIAKLLKRLKIDIKPSGISISLKSSLSSDERIKKIEDARINLIEGLKIWLDIVCGHGEGDAIQKIVGEFDCAQIVPVKVKIVQ